MSDFQSIIEARLLSYDPGIDLTAGSPAQTQIVAPLLARLESDPFSTDTRTFLKAKLKELFPSMSVIEGDAVVDILISAAQLYFEVYRREIKRVRDSQSINNIDLISDEDADALAANWLVNRNPGSFSIGIARALFANPTSVTIDSNVSFLTLESDKFIPAQTVFISAAQMLLNVLPGPQYYVDVVVRSALPGSKYNLEAGKLVFATSLPGCIGVTNQIKFSGGSDREDNRTLLADKLPQAITERSLTTARGVNARIRDLFSSIEASQVVGFKDSEMNRDLIWATAQGDTVGFGGSLLLGRTALITLLTENRVVIAGDQLTVTYPESLYPKAVIREETFNILEVTSRGHLNIMSRAKDRLLVVIDRVSAIDRISVPDPNGDEYPLGFIPCFGHVHGPPEVRVNVNQVEEILESGGIHVGGHTDVYLKPKTDSERAVTMNPTPDPQLAGHGLDIVDNQVTISGLLSVLSTIKEKDYLIIETGDNAGVYRIYGTKLNDAGTVTIYLNENLAAENAADNTRWIVTDNLAVNAFNPVKRLLPFGRTPLTVSTTIDQTEILTSVNVADFGVLVNDLLIIESGGALGTYTIVELKPASIIVNKIAPESSAGDIARIERPQRGIARPLTRITSMALSEDRTNIPYGAPIGMETLYLGGAKTVRDGVIGYVLPSLANFFPRDPNTGEFLDLVLPFLDNAAAHGWERPYTFGTVPRPLGSHVYTSEIRFLNQQVEYDQEFIIPKEVFSEPYKNNVFVAIGNIEYSDLEAWIKKFFGYVDDQGNVIPPAEDFSNDWRHNMDKYPLHNLNIEEPVPSKPGDILSVHSGPNKGNYVIQEVHQIKLNFGNFGTWHRRLPISIVIIEGSFPETPLDPLFGYLQGISPIEPGRGAFNFDSVLKLFLSPIQLTHQVDFDAAFAAAFDTFQDKMGINLPLLNNGNITPTQIREIIETYMYVPYSCGEPAKGAARVYFQEPVTTEIHTFSAPIEIEPNDIDVNLVQPPVFYGQFNELKIIPEVGEFEHHIRSSDDFLADDPRTWFRDLTVAPLQVDAETGKVFLPAHPFAFGIQPSGRDLVEVLPEKILIPSVKPGLHLGAPTTYDEDNLKGLAVATYKTGTNKLTVLSPSPLLESPWQLELEDVGSYLFIDGGPDAGSYIITAINEAERSIQVDKLLTSGTAKILARGVARVHASIPEEIRLILENNADADDNDRDLSSRVFSAADVGRYITLWNLVYVSPDGKISRTHVGSYKILSVVEVAGATSYQSLTIDSAIDWATVTGYAQIADNVTPRFTVFWTISDAPRVAPPSLGNGRTDLVNCVPIQIYEREPDKYVVADIDYLNIADFSMVLHTMENEEPGEEGIFDRIDRNNPYSVVRKGLFRISATEMAANLDGNLFYFDIPVQSLSHAVQANLPAGTQLVPKEFSCDGYRLVPKYKDLTYSTREEGDLLFPLSIIPEGSSDLEEERVSLLSKSVTISYDYSPEVAQFQALLDQPVDRIVCASMLARRMLPAIVGMNLRYVGGSVEKLVMDDFRKWIASLATNLKPLEVSDFISLVYNRGAKHVLTPIQLFAVVHDLMREIHLIKVTDSLKSQDLVNYSGTPRITGLMPGIINPTSRQVAIKATRLSNITALGSGG